MDGFQLVAALVQSFVALIQAIAWPACILGIIYFMRNHLGQILRALRNFKYKDLEISFKDQVEQTMEAAQNEGIVTDNNSNQQQFSIYDREIPLIDKINNCYSFMSEAYSIVEISPSSAVILSWQAVELSAKAIIIDKFRSNEKEIPNIKTFTFLKNQNIIDDKFYNLSKELRALRNKAAHADLDYNLSSKSATQYIALATTLLNRFKDFVTNNS